MLACNGFFYMLDFGAALGHSQQQAQFGYRFRLRSPSYGGQVAHAAYSRSP